MKYANPTPPLATKEEVREWLLEEGSETDGVPLGGVLALVLLTLPLDVNVVVEVGGMWNTCANVREPVLGD